MEIEKIIACIISFLIVIAIDLGIPILITYFAAALLGQPFSWAVVFIIYVIIQAFLNIEVAYDYLTREKK